MYSANQNAMTISTRPADAGEFRRTPQTQTHPMADLLLEPKRDDHQHTLGGRRRIPTNTANQDTSDGRFTP
jgi:hypothetical protein